MFTRKLMSLRNKKRTTVKEPDHKLPLDLTEKVNIIKPLIERNSDITMRHFLISGKNNLSAFVVFMQGAIDTNSLTQDILKPLMSEAHKVFEVIGRESFIDWISQMIIPTGNISKVTTPKELIKAIFSGFTVIMIDGFPEVLCIDIRAGENRAIDEPSVEKNLRGPRDGFIENIGVNVSLIRRKIKDPNLIVEKKELGKRSRTEIALIYIEDIASPEIINEVRKRIDQIEIDGNVATGFIEQLIEDNPLSIFPQTQVTERPDRVVANLLEGRIAIIADGTPFVIIVPSLFVQFLQASDDYYERMYIGIFVRLIRYTAMVLAISLPALYVSLLSYQQDLIPVNLLISLAEKRKEVPFPVVLEVLIMAFIIQIIIETGLRLPTPLGQTVGIAGGKIS